MKKSKKKKKRDRKEAEQEMETVDDEQTSVLTSKPKKRKKSKDVKAEEGDDSPTKEKKRKKTDVVDADLPGKNDRDQIACNGADNAKREATRTEAGQKQNGNLGQWATASFTSSSREEKFFRLLGGFKKSSGDKPGGGKKLFGSLANSKAHANFAMTAEQQKKLDNDMTNQYEKALGLRMNSLKSCGLGYEKPPEEGKTFYIDANKSKSRKFDD